MAIDEIPQSLGVGPRCAEWLKRRYPRNKGKLIARDFRVSENTAWRWLAGGAPTVAHLEEMHRRWGFPFIAFVFAEHLARRDARIEELERSREVRPPSLFQRRRTVGFPPPSVDAGDLELAPPPAANNGSPARFQAPPISSPRDHLNALVKESMRPKRRLLPLFIRGWIERFRAGKSERQAEVGGSGTG